VFFGRRLFFGTGQRHETHIDPSALRIPSRKSRKRKQHSNNQVLKTNRVCSMLGKTCMHGAANCKTKTLYPKCPDSFWDNWSVDCTVHDERMSFDSYFSELLHALLDDLISPFFQNGILEPRRGVYHRFETRRTIDHHKFLKEM